MTSETASDQAPLQIRALEKKAAKASIWSILEYGSGTCLRIVNSLVLTRLLAPAYFGEIALVSTLTLGISFLSDIGLAPSVIQSKRGDDPAFLNTAWTLQALRGAMIWLVAVAISWPAALFYRDQRLRLLLPALALSVLISGFNSTNLLTLSKHMGVRRLFAIDGTTSIVGLLVTLTWAYFRPSVWAIVAGQLISTLYRLCISFIPAVAPGIRNSFHWDKESVLSIVHFGKWIMVGTAFFFFASQSDRLILGRLISLSLLGVYGIAYQVSDVPRQIILALGQRVAYPFTSKIAHQPMEEFRSKFLHYRFFVLLAGAVMLGIMFNWGGLLIHLYDHRYRDAAWMVPILVLGLWNTLLYQTIDPALYALGKPKYNAIGHAVYCAFICPGIPIAFHFFGMFGAVIAVAAGDFPVYLVVQFGATREGIRPLRQDLKTTAIFISTVLVLHYLKRL